MSAESIVFGALSAYGPLTAITADRIWPSAIPEGSATPAIVFSRTNTEPIIAIGGRNFGEIAEISVQCWADSPDVAAQCGAFCVAAMLAAGETYADQSTGYDAEVGLYVTTVVFRVI